MNIDSNVLRVFLIVSLTAYALLVCFSDTIKNLLAGGLKKKTSRNSIA